MNLLATIGSDLAGYLQSLKESTSNEVKQIAALLEHVFQNASSVPNDSPSVPSDAPTTPTPGDTPSTDTSAV